MILNVSCPHCGALLDVTPEWLGQQLECGGCSSVFVCPELAEEAPPMDAPRMLREKKSRRERNRTRPDDGDRWEGYEAYSQDDDPDSHLSKKRGPGFAAASMVIGIISLTVATPITVVTCGFGGFVQITLSLVGLILGYIGMRSDARTNAIAGMVMNVLAALFATLWMTVIGGLISAGPFGKATPPTTTTTVSTWKSNANPQPAKAKW